MGFSSSRCGRVAGACLLVLALAGRAPAQEDPVAGAIAELLADGDVAAARKTLRQHGDREQVLAAAEAALARDTPGVRGKANVLTLFAVLRRPDLAEKALASPVVSTRRAAASQLPTSPGAADVLLAWLADTAAPDRDLAVTACATARIADARPLYGKLVLDDATDAATFAAAVRALGRRPPPEAGEVVRKRLARKDGDPVMIGASLDLARELPDLDVDDLIAFWLRRRDATPMVRGKAALALRDVAPAREVLLDPEEPNAIVQRTCLYRILNQITDPPLLELLRDPRVNRHRYFGIRVDVCTALACAKGTGPEDLALMCDYLVDEDPEDKAHIVRSEAWLTLWTLTGRMHGAENPELFDKAPTGGLPEMRTRRSFLRAGVKQQQARELERLAVDLDHMRKVKAAYAGEIDAPK